jgi:hypothetical protein
MYKQTLFSSQLRLLNVNNVVGKRKNRIEKMKVRTKFSYMQINIYWKIISNEAVKVSAHVGKKPMICTLPKSKPLIFNYRLTDMIFQITPKKITRKKTKSKILKYT